MTAAAARAHAPGRCTLVGEHVDYADGVVVCLAVHLGVDVAARPSLDGTWRMRSGTRLFERPDPAPRGDDGDLPFATAMALRECGLDVPPLELDVTATLPEGAGVSSSAALCCATAAAVLRMLGARLAARELCDLALHAERDLAGVPCGPLDHRAVVLSPPGGALVLDFRDGGAEAVPWPAGHVLAACHTGDAHSVGGEGYRSRRAEAGAALAALGAASYRDLREADVQPLLDRDPLLGRRARHIVGETVRAVACADALRRGDAVTAGALMSAGHASLRDDYEVSTPALDAVVAAAQATAGCLGARLVGAGFGGSAVALVEEAAAERCLEVMRAALPAAPSPAARGAWVLSPSPGLAALAADVLTR